MNDLKALYFPYTSPSSYDAILRGLMIYEEIGAICPRNFFLVSSAPDHVIDTPLERVTKECETYSTRNPTFILDPVDLIRDNEALFSQSVASDMKNPAYQASAPRGIMELYASKITRDIFERFRDKIGAHGMISDAGMSYREGPYRGTGHFIWRVEEPLAHSILLNLALLGVKQTNAIPMTDAFESHRAFLAKTSGADRTYDLHIVAGKLLRLVLPETKRLDIRSVLDFRDKYRNELEAFWRALAEDQEKYANDLDQGANDLYFESRVEFEGLKDSIKSAWETFRWGVAVSVVQLALGFVLRSPTTVITSPISAAISGMRYFGAGRPRVAGLSYLLAVQELL